MARHNVVRKIKNRTTIILVMLLISIMVSWVIWGNLSVETTKLTVTSKDLPEAFDNFSIAHISDLHNAEYGKNNEKLIDILKAESPRDLSEIKEELAEQGYISNTASKKKKKTQKSMPMKFISSDGYEILVGRNNKQNDEVTIRMSYSTDIWLHTKNIPGSHTLIRTNGSGEAPDSTILEAAQLAAYYSKAKNSAQVPVDYTQIKNVKKPNGAKPGFVIYEKNNTVYVTPKLFEKVTE